MEDMYSILAAKWYPQMDPTTARAQAKIRVLGARYTAGDPADELTDEAMNTLCDVIKAAVQRADAEEKINRAQHS